MKSPRKPPKKPPGVAVDESELGNRGWQTVDLSTPLSASSVLADAAALRRAKKWTSSTSLSMRWRSMVERGSGMGSACHSKQEQSTKRVPERDIIYVGRGPDPAAGEAESGDARTATAGEIVRQLLMLIALGAVIAGTFHIGQIYAKHNVIVVPAPMSFRSVVT